MNQTEIAVPHARLRDIPPTCRLLDMGDLCTALNRSRSTIYKLLEAGALPKPLDLGGKLAWRQSDIEAALERLSLLALERVEA